MQKQDYIIQLAEFKEYLLSGCYNNIYLQDGIIDFLRNMNATLFESINIIQLAEFREYLMYEMYNAIFFRNLVAPILILKLILCEFNLSDIKSCKVTALF